MINFKNKNILITGASGGIGNELVKKFLSLEGNVLATGTKTEKNTSDVTFGRYYKPWNLHPPTNICLQQK